LFDKRNIFGVKRVRKLMPKCGHPTFPLGEREIIIGGKKEKVIFETTSDSPLFCLDCFERLMTCCCNCGDSILMGSKVGVIPMENALPGSVYIPTKEGYVCCENCCDKKTEGYWWPVGEVTENFSFDNMGVVPEEEMPVDPRFK